MRKETAVTLYFSKHEVLDALELMVSQAHPALVGHFAGGAEIEILSNPETGESELMVAFNPQRSTPSAGHDETRIFPKVTRKV